MGGLVCYWIRDTGLGTYYDLADVSLFFLVSLSSLPEFDGLCYVTEERRELGSIGMGPLTLQDIAL